MSDKIIQQLEKSALERCRHFNGIQNKTCKAGVCYDDVRVAHEAVQYEGYGGRVYTRSRSLPCFADQRAQAGHICEKASFLTPDEAHAEAVEGEARFQLWGEASRRARERAKGVKGGRGTVECPKCGGTLHWSKSSYNGHIWGKCETPGCIAWME